MSDRDTVGASRSVSGAGRPRVWSSIVIAVWLAALLAGCGGGVNESSYLRANESVFRDVPRFPGATVEGVTSSAYRERDLGPVVGYTSVYTLRLARSTQRPVIAAYYRRRLGPTWQEVENLEGQVLNFRRGQTSLSVNLSNSTQGSYELAIDHEYYGKLGR